jgi:hypothetical protein
MYKYLSDIRENTAHKNNTFIDSLFDDAVSKSVLRASNRKIINELKGGRLHLHFYTVTVKRDNC